jgi:uncharacterized protein YukE
VSKYVGDTVNDSIEWGEPSSVTHGPASTERVLRRESDRLVANYRISVEGDRPVAVTVHDEFPPDLDVERVDVRNDEDSLDAGVTPTGATFESVVSPGEVLEPSCELYLGTEPVEPYGPPTIVQARPVAEHTDRAAVPPEAAPTPGGRETDVVSQSAEPEPTVPPEPTATVEALVEAFRADDLSEEQLGVLRDRLADRTSTSADVRIRRVESELARFEAYVDALEAFIEGNGTAQEAFTELRADLQRNRSEVATLRQTQQAAATERADVAAEVEELRGDVTAVTDEVATLRNETDALREEVEELRSLMESLSAVFAGDGDPADLPGR